MAIHNRVTEYQLTSPADNSRVELSVPVVNTGAKILNVTVQYSSPECSLLGVTFSDTANTAAETVWKVLGKAGSTYRVTLSVSEDDGL